MFLTASESTHQAEQKNAEHQRSDQNVDAIALESETHKGQNHSGDRCRNQQEDTQLDQCTSVTARNSGENRSERPCACGLPVKDARGAAAPILAGCARI